MLRRYSSCVGVSFWSDLDLGAVTVSIRGHWYTTKWTRSTASAQRGRWHWPPSFAFLPRNQVACGKGSLLSFSSNLATAPQIPCQCVSEAGVTRGQLLATAEVREVADWKRLMKPLICKYFYVLNGGDTAGMSLRCCLDSSIGLGFLGNLRSVLRLVKEAKTSRGIWLWMWAGFHNCLPLFFFFKCLAFIHVWITFMFVGNKILLGFYNSV